MCGIFGFIGQPTNPKAMYALLTQLALKTEIRGKEATGFWGAQDGDKGKIIYHKEPITATEFVQKSMWKKLRNFDPTLMLVHCREPTQGVGSPKNNRNNHPHVNKDYTVALIHNGKVEEYFKLKNKFDGAIRSQCDSELLLRIFETGEYVPNQEFLKEKYPLLDPENAYRVFGIEEIYKRLDNSHMAVAVGERHEGSRRSLWMWRNTKRPLHMVDLRSTFGVITFCSTMQIWREAVEATPEVKGMIPLDHSIVEFPSTPPYAYAITFDPTAKDETTDDGKSVEGGWKQGWKLRKYKLVLHREYGEEEPDKLQTLPTAERPPRQIQVLTGLNANEDAVGQPGILQVAATGNEDTVEPAEVEAVLDAEVESNPGVDLEEAIRKTHGIDEVTKMTGHIPGTISGTHEPPDDGEEEVADKDVEGEPESEDQPEAFDLERLMALEKEIKQLVADFAVEVHNMAIGGDISHSNFQQAVEDMEQMLADINGIKYHTLKGK